MERVDSEQNFDKLLSENLLVVTENLDNCNTSNSTKSLDTVVDTSTTSTTGKSTKTKCHMCKKKMLTTLCKCELVFCIKHLAQHTCTFDYREANKKELAEKNPRVIGSKITKI